MKKIFMLAVVVAMLQSCVTHDGVHVELYNPSDNVRINETITLDYDLVVARLVPDSGEQVVIYDKAGSCVPYQVTHDNKLIFQAAAVEPHSRCVYRIGVGMPDTFQVQATGAHYPQRVDDIAWENDCIAFRTYGPALQASGERAYGYDAWVKRVDYPVVADRYAAELNPETVAEVARLKAVDPDSAAALYNSVSYHVDHGNGLDYYKVGPTLGAGTSALLDAEGNIIYPYCYDTFEILDNGPLRFSMRLRYKPFVWGEDSVVETRVITLDKGSQLNRIDIVYENLSQSATMVSGIVLHDTDSVMEYSATAGYAAYAEPIDSLNGRIYVGMACHKGVVEATPRYFGEEERAERGAEGHLLMQYSYTPGEVLTYYAGAGWSKWGFETPEDWFVYMRYYADMIANPMQVSFK